MKFIYKLLTAVRMCWTGFFKWRPFVNLTHHPMQVQNALLTKILRSQADTDFGLDHGFADITSYADFVASVPVCTYENLRPYIELQLETKKPALNAESTVMCAQTSGTTGRAKYIPISRKTIDNYRNSQQLVAYAIYKAFPEAYDGKILAIASAAEEGKMVSGEPYGSMSGLIYKSMPTLMRRKYVLAPEIFEINDFQQKYHQLALQALTEPNISMIATANPSTLLKLDSVINNSIDALIVEIVPKDPQRALELRDILAAKSRIGFADLWPDLKVVVTWVGGNCSVLIPELRKIISVDTRVIELGYLSSEFRGGITIDVEKNIQIPCIHECFFEFVEQECWENNDPRFLTLDQIETGKQYYIFATTQDGLYRYDINDLIEVTGYFNKTPTIRFVQKGKGVINLTGEKLYESHLIDALNQKISEQGMILEFFMMLGCASSLEYVLYLEHEPIEAFTIENLICEQNIEYQNKRDSGRLKPLRIEYLRDGTGEAYKQYCLDNGQREGQFKLVYLQSRDDCQFSFDEYLR